ncbi:MAG: nitrogenase component 1 [Eubacteriales bacterium]|nr:nitrogenase component 1 [Eubacteriales bacterium]
MRPSKSCMLFGSYHALNGIKDSVVLFHSVIGCNFGTLGPHFMNDMASIRQSSTVMSDREVIYGGESQIRKAVRLAKQLYSPRAVFVVSGCVPEITGDDIGGVCADLSSPECPVIYVPSPGFLKDEYSGYEDAGRILADLAEEGKECGGPCVNILGPAADDPRIDNDMNALRLMLGPQIRVNYVSSGCSFNDILCAGSAGLNIVIGRGTGMAERLKERFGTPYRVIDYPYGITGCDELCSAAEEAFGVDLSSVRTGFRQKTADSLEKAFSFIQGFYAMPAAVVADSARARGMERFLTRELGMDVCVRACREEMGDTEDTYDLIRGSEAAMIFGSGYEKPLAEVMEVPLIRMCYPVLDRVTLSGRSYAGVEGSVCLVEDMINETMAARNLKGGLYQ